MLNLLCVFLIIYDMNFVFASLNLNFEKVNVEYDQGVLVGRVDYDRNGRKFFSFQGIPYAKPPLGDLRFKDPEPLEKWSGTLYAFKERSVCSQKTIDGKFRGDEDCLFLNVYTPSLETNKSLPVVFWIHGGSWVEGSGNSDIHGPHNFVSEDIVLVTVNYRLGVFGFMAFDDPKLNIFGNAALKDQLLALNWIQKYIHVFGGNREEVTIGGNSAGGVSADLLMLHNSASNLFKRAMIQSGCSTGYVAMGTRFISEFSEFLGIKNATDQEKYNILKNTPATQLIDAQIANLEMKLGPIVESPESPNPFLLKSPQEIIERGLYRSIPVLIGNTDQETMYTFLYLPLRPNLIPKTVVDFERYLPKDMNLTIGSDKSKKIAEKVKKFYYKDEEPSEDNIENFFALTSDTVFVFPINRHVRMLRERNSNIFYYAFTLVTELNLFRRQFNITKFSGAAHTDEKGYIFTYDGMPKVERGSQLDRIHDRVLKLWTNFVKGGNPNGQNTENNEWETVKRDRLNYLEIGEEFIKGVDPFKERVNFWYDLYEEACK